MSQAGAGGGRLAATTGEEPNLLDYWRIVWRRKLTIALIVIVAVAAAVGIDTVRTKQYTSTAQLLFLAQDTSASGAAATTLSQTQVATDIQLVESNAVKAQAAQILHTAPPQASVGQVGTTQVADISVTSSSPTFAADVANAYARAYISVTSKSFLHDQLATETALRTQLTSVNASISSVSTQLANAKPGSSQASGLTSQLGTLYSQQGSLEQQIAALQLATSQGSAGGEVSQTAIPATAPSSPKKLRDALIAALVGLLVGIGIALLVDRLDDRIHGKADLEATVGGIPTIGLIPMVSEWKASAAPYLASVERPASPTAEAYRGLRTSIQFASIETPLRVVQITSPSSAEGKTTTAANLAWTMAEAGQQVVLVDCDLRRPRVHQFFGISNQRGITNVLIGECAIDDALVAIPGQPRLLVLPSGTLPPNPSELLASRAAHDVFSALLQRSQTVIVDTPPVLPVTDASVLASRVSGVVLVAAAGVSTRRRTTQALETLTRLGAPIVGVVLNRAPEPDAYVYYGYRSSQPGANGNGKAAPRVAAANGARLDAPRDTPGARHAAVRRDER